MKADTSKDVDNRSPFTWRAATTSLMAVMMVVAGISILASSGQGIGWFFLALGLITALVAAWFLQLARKSRHPRG
ncbi:hypothetical protein BS329_37050 [Amycolatopsis coloradensis]|uniref:Uncharacterized protein n=1 Tax=Amycolatopsis coloradensis TaxID=76021 RepID=A0A1R0KFT8_9PSEU|nr:hypothetical protein [Amycolatopsis coloradensis]OLZ44286.1 hypothetical protein BS329_37050 [Amycolatopsis coloradensis]